jgi:hypothetical protein
MALSPIKIAQAFVEFVADLRGLKAGLKDAEGSTEKTVTKLGASWKKFAKVAGFSLAGAAIVKFSKDVITSADDMRDMSQRVGVATEDLSTLGYVAKLSGASLEDVGTGFRFISTTSQDAIRGNKELISAYQRLGISVTDLKSKSPKELFLGIADGLSKVSDTTTRNDLAIKTMGRSALKLVPTLNEVANGGFANARKEAEHFGAVVSTEFANKSDAFDDALGQMTSALGGRLRQALNAILPSLTGLVKMIVEIIAPTKASGDIMTLFGDAVALVAKAAIWSIAKVGDMKTELEQLFERGRSILQAYNGDFRGAIKTWDEASATADEAHKRIAKTMEDAFKTVDGATDSLKKHNKELDDVGTGYSAEADKIAQFNLQMRVQNEELKKSIALQQGNTAEAIAAQRAIDDLNKQLLAHKDGDPALIKQNQQLNEQLRLVTANAAAYDMLRDIGTDTLNAIGDAEDAARQQALKAYEDRKKAINQLIDTDDAHRAELIAANEANLQAQLDRIDEDHASNVAAILRGIVREYGTAGQQIAELMKGVASTMESHLADGFFDAIHGDLNGLRDNFKEFFKDIERQIIAFLAKRAIAQLLQMLATKGAGTTWGAVAGVIGGAINGKARWRCLSGRLSGFRQRWRGQ